MARSDTHDFKVEGSLVLLVISSVVEGFSINAGLDNDCDGKKLETRKGLNFEVDDFDCV